MRPEILHPQHHVRCRSSGLRVRWSCWCARAHVPAACWSEWAALSAAGTGFLFMTCTPPVLHTDSVCSWSRSGLMSDPDINRSSPVLALTSAGSGTSWQTHLMLKASAMFTFFNDAESQTGLTEPLVIHDFIMSFQILSVFVSLFFISFVNGSEKTESHSYVNE